MLSRIKNLNNLMKLHSRVFQLFIFLLFFSCSIFSKTVNPECLEVTILLESSRNQKHYCPDWNLVTSFASQLIKKIRSSHSSARFNLLQFGKKVNVIHEDQDFDHLTPTKYLVKRVESIKFKKQNSSIVSAIDDLKEFMERRNHGLKHALVMIMYDFYYDPCSENALLINNLEIISSKKAKIFPVTFSSQELKVKNCLSYFVKTSFSLDQIESLTYQILDLCGIKNPNKKFSNIEISFLVDSSGSLERDEEGEERNENEILIEKFNEIPKFFKEVLDFTKKSLRTLKNFLEEPHFNLIQFANQASLKINCTENLMIEEMEKRVDSLIFSGSNTNMTSAFYKMNQLIEKKTCPPAQCNLVLLVSDGSPTFSVEKLPGEVQRLKQRGWKIISVAVGFENSTFMDEISSIGHRMLPRNLTTTNQWEEIISKFCNLNISLTSIKPLTSMTTNDFLQNSSYKKLNKTTASITNTFSFKTTKDLITTSIKNIKTTSESIISKTSGSSKNIIFTTPTMTSKEPSPTETTSKISFSSLCHFEFTFLIDSSGSLEMFEKKSSFTNILSLAKKTVTTLHSINPYNRFNIIQFANSAKLFSNCLNDVKIIEDSIDNLKFIGKNINMTAAFQLVLNLYNEKVCLNGPCQIIILLSDRQLIFSQDHLKDLIQSIKKKNIHILNIGINQFTIQNNILSNEKPGKNKSQTKNTSFSKKDWYDYLEYLCSSCQDQPIPFSILSESATISTPTTTTPATTTLTTTTPTTTTHATTNPTTTTLTTTTPITTTPTTTTTTTTSATSTMSIAYTTTKISTTITKQLQASGINESCDTYQNMDKPCDCPDPPSVSPCPSVDCLEPERVINGTRNLENQYLTFILDSSSNIDYFSFEKIKIFIAEFVHSLKYSKGKLSFLMLSCANKLYGSEQDTLNRWKAYQNLKKLHQIGGSFDLHNCFKQILTNGRLRWNKINNISKKAKIIIISSNTFFSNASQAVEEASLLKDYEILILSSNTQNEYPLRKIASKPSYFIPYSFCQLVSSHTSSHLYDTLLEDGMETQSLDLVLVLGIKQNDDIFLFINFVQSFLSEIQNRKTVSFTLTINVDFNLITQIFHYEINSHQTLGDITNFIFKTYKFPSASTSYYKFPDLISLTQLKGREGVKKVAVIANSGFLYNQFDKDVLIFKKSGGLVKSVALSGFADSFNLLNFASPEAPLSTVALYINVENDVKQIFNEFSITSDNCNLIEETCGQAYCHNFFHSHFCECPIGTSGSNCQMKCSGVGDLAIFYQYSLDDFRRTILNELLYELFKNLPISQDKIRPALYYAGEYNWKKAFDFQDLENPREAMSWSWFSSPSKPIEENMVESLKSNLTSFFPNCNVFTYKNIAILLSDSFKKLTIINHPDNILIYEVVYDPYAMDIFTIYDHSNNYQVPAQDISTVVTELMRRIC